MGIIHDFVQHFRSPYEAFCLMDPRDFQSYTLSVDDFLSIFEYCDAYWMHSGDPRDPHAETTQGLCTNGFFDCFKVLKYLKLSELFANQHARAIREQTGNIKIDWAFGSPMAGITYAHDLARALGIPIAHFTEKDPANKKKMLWNRDQIPAGAAVLQIEELITTAGTSDAVRHGVSTGNIAPVNFLPYLATLVHRPPVLVSHYADRKVIPLIEKVVWAVEKEDCPLCKQGSERMRPKQNWARLTRKAA